MIDENKLIKELDAWWEMLSPRIEARDSIICDVIESVIEKINNAEKCGEWIPVTHEIDEESGEYMFTCQLPEEGERVIVVDRRGYIDIDEQCYDTDGWYLDGGDWNDIVAWMPLPELYGEEKANETD